MTDLTEQGTESAVSSESMPPRKVPLPGPFTLNEKEIKQAIREYVGRAKGVDPNAIGVALTAKQRGWFGGRADFIAPVSFVDLEALRNRARR
jgi:hypothetical protein